MALCDLVELLIIDYKFPEGNFLFYRTLMIFLNALPLGNIVRIPIDSDAIIYELGLYVREL